MSGIEPVSGPLLPSVNKVFPARRPIAPKAGSIPTSSKPYVPIASQSRPIPNSLPSPILRSPRRKLKPYEPGTVTNITSININIDSGRIAFLNKESAPVLGDVDTDLPVGLYDLTVNRLFDRWVFPTNQVKPGYHFNVSLESNADPFSDFFYADPVPVSVQNGLTRTGPSSFANTREWIRTAAYDKNWFEVMWWYATMSDVDLYDLLNDFWYDPSTIWVIHNSIFNWAFADELEQDERLRILRALESLTETKQQIYVDNFDRCVVHPSSFGYPDPERARAGLWNIKLVFIYDRAYATQRGVVFFIDDIQDNDFDDPELPQYGEGAVLMPRYISRKNCPRMWKAKLDKIKEIETQNLEFIWLSWQTVDAVLSMYQAAGSMAVRSMVNARRSVMVLSPDLKARMIERLREFLKDETGSVAPGKLIAALMGEAEVEQAGTEAVAAAPISEGSGGAKPVEAGQGASGGKGTLKGGSKSSSKASTDAAMGGKSKDFSQPQSESRWLGDFEGGANQRQSDAEYAAKAIQTPKGRKNVSFWHNGRRFDGAADAAGNPTKPGEKPALLIEAKNWRDGGMFWRILTKRWAGWSAYSKLNSKIAEAQELLKAADGVPLEYRVNSQTCATELQKVFKTWGLDIKVVAKVVPLK